MSKPTKVQIAFAIINEGKAQVATRTIGITKDVIIIENSYICAPRLAVVLDLSPNRMSLLLRKMYEAGLIALDKKGYKPITENCPFTDCMWYNTNSERCCKRTGFDSSKDKYPGYCDRYKQWVIDQKV